MIHKIPEVEKRLSDDISRKIYDMRVNFAIYEDLDYWTSNVLQLSRDWKFNSKFETFVDDNKIENIVIFGAGEYGRNIVLCMLNSRYRNLNIFICDNDKIKQGLKIHGFDVLAPEEAVKIPNSVITIGICSKIIYNQVHQQLLNMGYPEEKIFRPLCGTSEWQYFDYFKPSKSEIFVDGGCLNGKTSVEFTKWVKQESGGGV